MPEINIRNPQNGALQLRPYEVEAAADVDDELGTARLQGALVERAAQGLVVGVELPEGLVDEDGDVVAGVPNHPAFGVEDEPGDCDGWPVGRLPQMPHLGPPHGRTARRLSQTLAALSIAAIVAFVLAASPETARATLSAGPDLGKCLDLSGRTTPRLSHVDDGLGLTREQILEAKQRVSDYWDRKTTAIDLSGLGFTPEQEATFLARVNAELKKSSWPLGWPCKPFTHRSKVIKFVTAELIANGFRPRMRVVGSAPRQIRISAIQDGLPFIVLVVRAGGPRTILVSLKPASTGYSGDSASYTLPYAP